MKLVKLIANLGYGSRKDVAWMFREGRITDASGEVLYADDQVEHGEVRVDGEPLDPPQGLILMLHKPTGYTCSTTDAGHVVYDLLPPRFRRRSPIVATVGRLDRDTSGLLLMTDDGALLHRIVHPKRKLPKVYEAALARDLRGDEAKVFASGKLMLESEKTPLAPAALEALGPRLARLTLIEGRYHQARRMFAAVGNHVEALHRSRIGGLTLEDLPEGKWRSLNAGDLERLFALAGEASNHNGQKEYKEK
jgi:16S rRNA pseudouridine516 synthase